MKKEYLILGASALVIYGVYLLLKNKPKTIPKDLAKGKGIIQSEARPN